MNESWNPLLKSYPFSEKVNSLSLGAEMLFVRLIAQADDHGNYYGEPRLILASLFPHRFAKKEVNETDTGRWRNELVTNPVGPLAALYYVNGSEYIHLLNSRRRIRSDVKPDQRFPREPEDIEQKATFEHVTRAARKRPVNVPLDKDQDQDQDQEEPIVGNEQADTVIGLINHHCTAKFRCSETSRRPIRARLAEGATVEDCLAVIRHKASQWLGDAKMAEYLRPGTLFCASKFDGYLSAARRWMDSGCPEGEQSSLVVGGHGGDVYEQQFQRRA